MVATRKVPQLSTRIVRMECSICLDTINAGTGLYTSSCGHPFHLGCIGRWILKNESCPNCRHDFVEKEKILEDEEEEEEDDDYDEDDEDDGLDWRRTESGRWVIFTGQDIPEFDPESHALWVMRRTFEMADAGMDLHPPASVEHKHGNATHIQPVNFEEIDRGYDTD